MSTPIKRMRALPRVVVLQEHRAFGRLLREVLRSHGCDALVSGFGQVDTAMRALRAATVAGVPRAVVIGVELRQRGGFALLRRLRADASLADVPTLLLSPAVSGGDVLLAGALGVDVAVELPLRWEEFGPIVQRLRELLALTAHDPEPEPTVC